jgi:hypothetical protein
MTLVVLLIVVFDLQKNKLFIHTGPKKRMMLSFGHQVPSRRLCTSTSFNPNYMV